MGMASAEAAAVMTMVPMIAGPMPGPSTLVLTGMSVVNQAGKSRKTMPAPLAMTVPITVISGMSTTMNDISVRPIMSLLLMIRQVRRLPRRSAAVRIVLIAHPFASANG